MEVQSNRKIVYNKIYVSIGDVKTIIKQKDKMKVLNRSR